MVPILYELRTTSPLRGFLLSGLFGWLMWFTSVWWLQAPLRDIVGMSGFAAILFTMAGCLLMAFPYAMAGAIICKWPRQSGIAGAARDAAIFTVTITWLTPILQGSIAHTQYQYPIVLQILELGGSPLLLFLIFWVNWLVADGVLAFQNNRSIPWKPLGASVAIFSTVIIYGAIRLQQFDSSMKSAPRGQWLTVGAVQPNIPIAVMKERQPDPNALANDFFSAMEQAKELAQRHPEIDLLALPENPATFLFNQDPARRQALGKLITETGKPVILNVDAFDSSKAVNGIVERYNIAVLMDANRDLTGSYPKIKRIPVVEYIPGETAFPWLRKCFPKSMRVLEGPSPVVFGLRPGVKIIPLICYEGTVSSFTRQFVRKGGNVIVNQVNDSWFLRTPASEVHLALTLFRTIEYRVPLVRVTNSGIGAHIQADGRIVPGSRTELFTKTATAFPLYVPPRRSVYAQIGNYWMIGFAAFLFEFVKLRTRKHLIAVDSRNQSRV